MRVAIIASASGSGKTTLGRSLAARLDVPFVEMDALVHGPGWAETSDAELRRRVEPMLAQDGWVFDNVYRHKLGTLVLDAADVVVWLDLPPRVWLPRLLRRTARRLLLREQLWNGNRETLRGAFWGCESLFGYAIAQYRIRRRDWPRELAGYRLLRLRAPTNAQALERALTTGKTCRS
jgi:adenylate kinase family enzyme